MVRTRRKTATVRTTSKLSWRSNIATTRVNRPKTTTIRWVAIYRHASFTDAINVQPMEESQSNARAEERAVSSPTRARAEATSGPPRADITNEEGGTSGQQTQPGASETPLANNRRSRSVDKDQDEQGEQNAGRPTISIPPCKTKPKSKKRRRY